MLLDQTEIAIRERGKRELYDLALHVARRHFWPLALAMLLGVAPFAAFNAWALSPLEWDRDDFDPAQNYVVYQVLLVSLELPLASALVTLYLGQVLFRSRTAWRQLASDYRRCAWQLWWYLGVVRGALVAMAVVALNNWRDRNDWPETIVILIAVWAIVARCARPYLGELVLLERNPRRSSRGMTTAKRSASLHASYGGDGFVQMIAAVVLGGLATFSLWLSLCYLRREMWNVMEIDRTAITVILPIALWTTGWFLTVVRFLGYLDLRIRREGWEVELRMRAEALAMSGATRSDAVAARSA